MKSAFRRGAGALTAAAVAAGVFAGTAEAGQNVVAAIKSQEQAVIPSLKVLDKINFSSPSDAKKYVPKLQTAVKKLNTAANVVARASASSSTQKQGQADWVKGIRGDATALGYLVTALKDISSSNQSGALTYIHKAKVLEKSSTAIGEKGEKLLGIKG
jgi:hypothetical protein